MAAPAADLVHADAHGAYVLAHDAARFSCIALLAQQGMRAITEGGCYAVETCGGGTVRRGFPAVRRPARRWNKLEYPRLPADTATADDAQQAVEAAQRLIAAVGKLLGQFSFFAQRKTLKRSGCTGDTCQTRTPVRRSTLLRSMAPGRGRHSTVSRATMITLCYRRRSSRGPGRGPGTPCTPCAECIPGQACCYECR